MDAPILPQMSIVVVGHVDHGKSTVVGRLLADTGVLPQGKLEQVQETCRRNGRPFEYAYLIDALKDERSQGITIDAARVFFKSHKRRYLINDAPGHIEFLKNMVTGASRAEAALLVIDAQEGVRENSRRHGYLLWLLGIRKIVVLINKMDLVGYSREVFENVRAEYASFLSGIGVRSQAFLPVSGLAGDNISQTSDNMPWHLEGTVLSALDSFESEPPPSGQPLRLPVQDIYKFSLFGDNRRIVAGSIAAGSLRMGDELVFYPSGKRSKIATLEAFNESPKVQIGAGEPVGVTLDEQIYIQRGEIACRAGEPAPKVSTRLRVSLFWLGRKPLSIASDYILKLGTARVSVRVETIHRIIDAGGDDLAGAETAPVDELHHVERHRVAEVTLKLARAVAFDLAAEARDTSRFVLVEDYEICGGGIVLEDLPDSAQRARELVVERNFRWIHSLLTSEQRAEHYNQRAALILITGEQRMGRKRIANQLEADLFNSGKFVYYLGIGSVIHGVDADLSALDPRQTRSEHIRRLAEVAHILLDAGLILIVTAIELTQSDLDLIKAIVNGSEIPIVWVGDRVTTDLAWDLQVPGADQINTSVAQIKRLLQERGIIFKP
jgi:bifunctional enzyme CysN/CysC